MATINYKIKSGTKKIYCSITQGKEIQVRKSTGKEIVNPKNWLKDKKKVRVCAEEINAKYINDYIQTHKSKIITALVELEKNNIDLTEKLCHKIIDNIDNSVQEKRSRNHFKITDHLDEYIKQMISGKKLWNGEKFSKETVKGYKTLIKNIEEFELNKKKIKPHQIDYKLYEEFVYYFRNEATEEYRDSYVGSIIKKFKAFINNYLIKDLNLKLDNYRPEEWKKPDSKSLKTYLTLNELNTLLSLDLSSYPKEYDNVRDTYCFIALACGIRIGDYLQLKKHNLSKELIKGKEKHFLIYKQSKTNVSVKAPIPKTAMKIIEKHNGFPKIQSAQKSNNLLKELGQLCNFSEEIILEDHKGNIIDRKKKYELMTNHSARRSFCTNAYDKKTDLIQIMKISGHSSPDILLAYIGKTLDEFAERMINTDYFNAVDDLEDYVKMKAV